jgi:hypothetical protein
VSYERLKAYEIGEYADSADTTGDYEVVYDARAIAASKCADNKAKEIRKERVEQ